MGGEKQREMIDLQMTEIFANIWPDKSIRIALFNSVSVHVGVCGLHVESLAA